MLADSTEALLRVGTGGLRGPKTGALLETHSRLSRSERGAELRCLGLRYQADDLSQRLSERAAFEEPHA